MIIFSLMKDEFTAEQMERLFSSYQVFWQVLFYTLLVLVVFFFFSLFFDGYAKRKYKDTLSDDKRRVIEDYNSIDFLYLIKVKKDKRSNIEKLIDEESRKDI